VKIHQALTLADDTYHNHISRSTTIHTVAPPHHYTQLSLPQELPRHDKAKQTDVSTLIEPLIPPKNNSSTGKDGEQGAGFILGTLRIEGRNEVESSLVTA